MTSHISKVARLLLLFVAGVLVENAGYSTTLLTNLGDATNGVEGIFGSAGAGVGFTINAGGNLNLDDAMFTLFNGINGSPLPAIDLTTSPLGVGIYADNAGHPAGSALVTMSLGITTLPGGQGTYTATPDSPFTLVAGDTYWLVLNDQIQGPNVFLTWQTTNLAPTTNGATFTGGQTGQMTSITQISDGSFGAASPVLFQIDASPAASGAVPEPGTFVLLGVGILGLWTVRKVRDEN